MKYTYPPTCIKGRNYLWARDYDSTYFWAYFWVWLFSRISHFNMNYPIAEVHLSCRWIELEDCLNQRSTKYSLPSSTSSFKFVHQHRATRSIQLVQRPLCCLEECKVPSGSLLLNWSPRTRSLRLKYSAYSYSNPLNCWYSYLSSIVHYVCSDPNEIYY